jgi:3-hydroxybutyryl-CoA dehydrogenase
MHILVVGEEIDFTHCREQITGQHQFKHITGNNIPDERWADVVFIFTDATGSFPWGAWKETGVVVFVNSVITPLSEIASLIPEEDVPVLFGFNGLPTFFRSDKLEVCMLSDRFQGKLQEISVAIGISPMVVKDRPGMVAARVICMIINEAYHTLGDGTASRADIDTAMKLGTNYPYGPFEWCARIGVKNVYLLLAKLEAFNNDRSYRTARLLEEEYFSIVK